MCGVVICGHSGKIFACTEMLLNIKFMFRFSLQLLSETFLGAFAKLRKANISFTSVRLSAWNKSAPTGRVFMKFEIGIFSKIFEKFQDLLKSDKNRGLNEDKAISE
jgi:hypothetical protein